MANSENGTNQPEEAAAASAIATDADEAISDTHLAAEREVATRIVVTEVELREMKNDIKDFMEASWIRKADSIAADQKRQNEELRGLYNGAMDKIKEIESRITVLQTPAPRNDRSSSWKRIKDLAPEVFYKKKLEEMENRYREDYIETLEDGMEAVSKKVAREKKK